MSQRISHLIAALVPVAALSLSAGAHAQSATPASLPAPAVQPTPVTGADAPAYTVGEQWTFHYENALEPAKNATYTQAVSRIDGASVEVNGGAIVLDASSNVVKSASASYEPSDGKLHFPMHVGDTWSATYTYRTGTWESAVQRQTRVVGVEGVDTPAGHFDAFKIEQVASWTATGGNRGQGTTQETDWYAPAIGRIVKAEYVDRVAHGAPTTTHLELTQFSRPQ
jgi:hypothetical protein